LVWLAGAIVVCIGVALLSLTIGTRDVPLSEVLAALSGDATTLDRAAVATRVPRTVLALLAGAALGLAGAVMQGVTRNPLADDIDEDGRGSASARPMSSSGLPSRVPAPRPSSSMSSARWDAVAQRR